MKTWWLVMVWLSACSLTDERIDAESEDSGVVEMEASEDAPPEPVVTVRTVKEGESLSVLLAAAGVKDIYRTVDAIGEVYPSHKIRVGNELHIVRDPTDTVLLEIRYRIDQGKELRIKFVDGAASEVTIETCRRVLLRRMFTIAKDSSFWLSALAEGFPERDIATLANLFRYEVDIADTHAGDGVVAVGEVCEDKPEVGFQVIHAARVTFSGTAHEAFCLMDGDKGCRYFDRKGDSVDRSRAFLRSPLDLAHPWGSGFNPRRIDPIDGGKVAHLAVDIAAPVGTPIHATGDGQVVAAGDGGGCGLFVRIQHGNHKGKRIETMYCHQSRLKVKKGQKVKQGQVIGLVGTTGHSTGPHVHYAYIVDGKPIDPAKAVLPATTAHIGEQERAAFQDVLERWTPVLDGQVVLPRAPIPPVVASPSTAVRPVHEAPALESWTDGLTRVRNPVVAPAPIVARRDEGAGVKLRPDALRPVSVAPAFWQAAPEPPPTEATPRDSFVVKWSVGATHTDLRKSKTWTVVPLSASLGERRVNVQVWVGAAWEPGKRLEQPIVVVLPGWKFPATKWDDQADLRAKADRTGVIVVAPEMNTTVYEADIFPQTLPSSRWLPGAGLGGGTFVVDALLPWLQSVGRVAGVMGLSTGGRGAVVVAERWAASGHEPLPAVCALSGTYDLERLAVETGEYRIHELVYGDRRAFADRWRSEDVLPHVEDLRGSALRIVHGASDPVVPVAQQKALVQALQAADIPVTPIVVQGAGHDWKLWSDQTEECLRFLAEHGNAP